MTYQPPDVYAGNYQLHESELDMRAQHMLLVQNGEAEATIYDQLRVSLNKVQHHPVLSRPINMILVVEALLDIDRRLKELEARK